jgi:hypothetical protein
MSGLIGRSINMTEITKVKTGAAPTTDLICPLMSGQIVPVPGRAGRIDTPGATTLAPSVVTCARENCRWWDESSQQCVLFSIAEEVGDVNNCLVSLRSVLEPPTESPLAAIADSLHRIWQRLDRDSRV